MRRVITHVFVATAKLLSADVASAVGLIDPLLSERLAAGPGPDDVVITFKETSDSVALANLSVNFVPLQQLPMAGAKLTTSQVHAAWQSAQRTRRKPCSGQPHFKYDSNSSCTYCGSGRPAASRLATSSG